MAQAEFEFWKIDSAFEDTSISACMHDDRYLPQILDRFVEKTLRVGYNTEKLRAAFENFGWTGFLPLEKRGFFSAKQVYEHCHRKLVAAYGTEHVKKKYDDAVSAEKFVSAVYFAYKATDLLARRVERDGISISVFKNCKIPFIKVIRNLYLTKGVPKDRIYASVLTVLIYAVEEDFTVGLSSTQKEVDAYAIGKGHRFSKELSQHLVDFLKITAEFAFVSQKGGSSESYQLVYPANVKEGLEKLCSDLKIGYQERRGGRLSVDTITPFKIMSNYFGLGGSVNKETIVKIAVLAEKKLNTGTLLPKLHGSVEELWLVHKGEKAEEIRPHPKKPWFGTSVRALKRMERMGIEKRKELEKERLGELEKEKKELKRTGLLFRFFKRWEAGARQKLPKPAVEREVVKKEPVKYPSYNFSKVKFTKETAKAWIIRLYADGVDLSYEVMRERYRPLFDAIVSNFLSMKNGLRLETKPFFNRKIEEVIFDFIDRTEKELFGECSKSAVCMKALCRFAKEKKDLKLKAFCERIFRETENDEVEEAYLQFFK